MREIKRGAALALLASQGVPTSERARNYEIEQRLRDLPGVLGGDDWIVAELCPFDGAYCQWGEVTGEMARENERAAERWAAP